MKKQINLSDGEWKLMNRLWDRNPMTIMELTAALREETGWTKNTVITMLSRLEAKGAVRCVQGVRAKQYSPAIERQAAAQAETENFLGKVYGGSLGLMMSAMVESRGLSEADIAELSAILEQAGGKEK
ncbi:MAG: BlaI/MecI/CopY family transcriptional regulator [Oscillospiraceae bacterium]|nr:BlaI/MecI/CopY family transcriptional regulator [Oscillospiraceae bacterium]